MQFPFSEWAPDAGETTPGILMQASGVQPVPGGYGPARALQTPASADALPDTCRGLNSSLLNDGTNVVFGFTETDIYQLNADYTWSTAIGSSYSCTAGDDWSVARFGNKLLATNTTDGLLQYDVESPVSVSAIADAGDPREIFVCANIVVGLDCLDDSSTRDQRLIRTSAIGDHTQWKLRGADKQPLSNGGPLIGGASLKNNAGVIFQTDAMNIIQFGAGGAGQFSLAEVSVGRGAVGAKSIVSLDGVVYWLSTDGFKRFSLNNGIEHIGAGRIDGWFLDRINALDMTSVQGGLDPVNKLVVWRFPSLSITSDTVFDDLIGYSWQYNKWFAWSAQTTYLSRIATPGYTLDGMNDFGPLDSIDTPLDDRFWQGGQPVFAALDSARKYATFSGSNFAATLETSVSNSPVTGLIGRATPIDDSPDGTLQLGVKDRLDQTTTWKAGSAKRSAGRVPMRGRGMNIAFRRNIPSGSDWTYAKGVDHIKAETGGGK